MQNSSTPPSAELLRVLDAAANRAAEGLRVVEDYVRFVLDDAHLTACCKELRHDLTAALAGLPAARRAASRQTADDVGTGLTTPAEIRRTNFGDLLTANLARLQQALRSLEEHAKLLESSPGTAPLCEALKSLRYRGYTLGAALETRRASGERLSAVRLMVLVDGRGDLRSFEQLVSQLVSAGVGAIQLRDKGLSDRELLARARALVSLSRDRATLAIVNDRADVAAAARADGVHLGQDDLGVKEARSIVGPEALLGVSTHSLDQARRAVLAGASYLGVGPAFPSGTKSFESFPGPALLRQVAGEIGLPAFAIGGITAAHVPEVLACGFRRMAVGQAVTAAADPGTAATEILALLTKTTS